MSKATRAKPGFWLNIIVVVACFAIFAILLAIAYIPQQSNSLTISSTSDLTPAQRTATLDEMRAKEKSAATTYGWVDQTKGVVRLPIDRAMELVIQEHAKKNK